MTGLQRDLPPWMSLKEQNAKPKQTLTKSRNVSRTVYCMNEKELVEAAIAFLNSGASDGDASLTDHQEAKGDKMLAGTVRNKDRSNNKMEETLDEFSSSGADRTYISETDLDTVDDAQAAPSNLCCSPSEGQRSIQAQANRSPVALDASAVEETPPTEVGEDDALKLVREIFFT